MLETLRLLADSLPDIHWHMVGGWQGEAYLRTLQKQAARLGVGHLITWHGYRRDVAEMMLSSDVAVLASHSEGVPRAVQESMALGVPTVMPAAFAADVSHDGLPVTYCRQAPGDLAAAIEAALRVDTHRLRAAASWVTRRWGWEAVLSDWKRAVT
jgi:glycosyltransferase involved in cell wall biosynthesis